MKKHVLFFYSKLLCLSLLYSAIIVLHTPAICCNQEDVSHYLTNHVKKVTVYINFANDWLNAFFSEDNNRSYDDYLKEFKVQLEAIHKDIVTPINIAVKKSVSDTTHTAMLKTMHSITHDINTLLRIIYTEFYKQRTCGNEITLGYNLYNLNNTIIKELKKLKPKLCDIKYKAQATHAPFAQDVSQLITWVDGYINQKIDIIAIQKALKHRIKVSRK